MTTKTYVAMFEPANDGVGISFPDLPGCVSFASDFDSGVRNAAEALSLHLEGMAEDGEALPEAGSLVDLIVDQRRSPEVLWTLITVEAPDAADRVNVYLPRSLLARVDRYVTEHAPMNRSTFFGEAARAHLRDNILPKPGKEIEASDHYYPQGMSSETWSVGETRPSHWGGQTLRGVLEVAGLSKRFDFVEQGSIDSDEGRLRPDVIVRMPGGGKFAIDAKCSLNAFLDARDAVDETRREEALSRHAQDVRAHLKHLCSRTYWDQFQKDTSPDFVAMFLPSDGFLAAVLDRLPALMSEALENRVLLVAPTTLFALCKAVAYDGHRSRGHAQNLGDTIAPASHRASR